MTKRTTERKAVAPVALRRKSKIRIKKELSVYRLSQKARPNNLTNNLTIGGNVIKLRVHQSDFGLADLLTILLII